jgi:hypothetical protein
MSVIDYAMCHVWRQSSILWVLVKSQLNLFIQEEVSNKGIIYPLIYFSINSIFCSWNMSFFKLYSWYFSQCTWGDETVKWIWKIGNTLVLQLTRSLICVWRNNCQQRICDFDWAGISFNGADVGVNGVVILCFSFICLIKHINLLQFLFYTK